MATVLGTAIVNGVFSMTCVSEPRTFQDGDLLDIPGRPHVIHMPGHTAGEVAFHLPDRGVLISGDSLVTQDLYTGAAGRPQLTRPGLNDDYEEARRSLERLGDLGRVKILPGHGKLWQGLIEEAIATAREA